ncbi:hypothetical protein Achl_4268 (plasmid) [Pseudarthrobacter chlorophenolicus A6]|uniref:Uncharacterized protein n=1 Tax=Pseudarthrobacter chlorophenolicus (strain ATCC 700700 / DSM 12829 / CIP 107037 / JCM 12360 / KCTC 9906 / NCIMB 13794 / A6) TaxID=452863 RepID=B8HIH2_PSECP|nr:hypothetical protein [Pseudarthrobacter chlorophenolicus]ACL42219.1 hypothetical protein Achl_4268 [Pseudarthrobacter chlorophenolicus A6]SDQ15054.1 hypothetical protein SAMN04489738_0326 [Pseudarthrobacter chlorophenolicus]
MSRRKHDARRRHANELRRIKLAGRRPWILGPYYRDELSAMLDIPMGDPRSIEAERIVAERQARTSPVSRLCSNGRCSVVVDSTTGRSLYSVGPSGCCDE